MTHFVLLYPNTSTASTRMMLKIARETLAGRATIEGITAEISASVITDPARLRCMAQQAVAA